MVANEMNIYIKYMIFGTESGARVGGGAVAAVGRGGARGRVVGGARPRARRLARARRQHARRGTSRFGFPMGH